MVDDNVGNQVRHNVVQYDGNEGGKNLVQNPGIQIVENMKGLSVVLEIANQYRNRNVEIAPAEGNSNGINGNPIRCYNYQGEGHYASNCTDTLKQASTSGTQSDNAPVYDLDGSTKYDYKVTIQSRPSMILFVKEKLSKSNKRLKLFKDTVFGMYLDLDVEDNDNHLMNYVLHHQRPQLSKSIDSNLVIDIVGHTLLFGRRLFSEKAKNLENKASLGKAAKGKAAKGKAAKGKDAKRKAAQGKVAQLSDIGDTHSVIILDLRSLIWDDEKWKKLSVEDSIRVCLLYMSEQIFMGQEDKKVVNNSFLRLVEDLAAWDDFSWGEYYWEEFYKKAVNLIDNHRDTHTNFKKNNPSKLPTFGYWNRSPKVITGGLKNHKERDENWCRKTYDYVACKERSKQVDDRNGFTRDDKPKAEQDGSGASDRASARSKFEETKSTREVALEEELNLWKSRYVKLESYYKKLEASVEIARKNSSGLSLLNPNAKATSVCDDTDEADATADDNSKATSVHDDVGVPDSAADDNVKATSVCDDIDEDDVTADDNAKATSVHDDVGVPDAAAAADDNANATSVCDDIDEADAAADDNVKATSVHDDVCVPDVASDDNEKAMNVCDDINEADVAADDNAKATSVHDNVGVLDATADDSAKVPMSNVYNMPVDNKNVLMKDAHKIINHAETPIHGFQIMLWGGLEKKGDGLDEAKANQDTKPKVTAVNKTRKMRHLKRCIQEVVSTADNGEVVKETQLPDSHEDVFQPRASKRMKKETLLSDCPPVIGNYLKEIYIARWEERSQRAKDKNTRPQRSFGLFKSSKEATSLVSLREWLERQSMPTRAFSLHITAIFQRRMTSRTGYSRTSRRVSSPFMIHSTIKNLGTRKTSLVDQISATDEQTTTEGHVKSWCLQAKEHTSQGLYNHLYFSTVILFGLACSLFPCFLLDSGFGKFGQQVCCFYASAWIQAWIPEPVLKHDVPFIYELWVPTTKYANKDTRDEDKDTRGNTRDGKSSREGENHTRKSASILHEFYNDIGKLGLD
nr:hypothetical protein [Tanacetum cinerariifolium]